MRIGPSRLFLPMLATLVLAGTALADAALAETVPLRSGKNLEVEAVRVLDDRLNVTVRRDGESVRVELRFELIDPRGLLFLYDSHTDTGDPRAILRGARLALAHGLRNEAAARFIAAARTDPKLRAQRDEALAKIRALEAADGLNDLEARVRAGRDPRGAMVLAAAILDSVHTASLTPAQRRRVEALGALARRLVVREAVRALQAASAQGPSENAEADAPGSPLDEGDAPAPSPEDEAAEPADDMVPVRALLLKALRAREEAADPKVPVPDAIRHLEIAAKALLDGRRAVRQVPTDGLAEAARKEIEDAALDLRDLLVATYLDLADLYRQEGYFEEARARIRAVLILEPGNEQAWTQRQMIEDDLRDDYMPVEDPYRYTIRTPVFFGYCSPSPFYGAYVYPRAVPYAGSHFGGSFFRGYARFGYGGRVHRHGGTRRAVGRR